MVYTMNSILAEPDNYIDNILAHLIGCGNVKKTVKQFIITIACAGAGARSARKH